MSGPEILSSTAQPLISPFTSQPHNGHTLLGLAESHLVYAQLSPWL